MKMPKGFSCEGYEANEVVLELQKNLYGQKQAGCIWCEHLAQLLTEIHEFIQSTADECIFYQDGIILLIYVDDTVCVYRDVGAGAKLAEELRCSFDITVEGTIY